MPNVRAGVVTMADADLVLLVGELRARVAALEARLSPQPVTTVRAAAGILGVSEDTVHRARARAGDTSRPWWSGPDAVREWWGEMAAPKQEPAKKPRAPKPRGAAKVFDAQSLMDEVSGRRR